MTEAIPAPNEDRGRGTFCRASRWGGEAKHGIPGTLKLEDLTSDQIALYALHVRIEEIGRLLRSNDYIPPSPERSPSPEPFYGADGKRINTREFRFRKKLEDERHKLVSQAMKLDPTYRPPGEYRRPTKLSEKIYIPVKEFPEINFIGLLLGPRGSTLKTMEAESQAKIAIRGKGSVKEGKGAPTSYQNQEEDLHCLITADSESKVKAAVDMVNKIIETASTVPEAQNELKRKQLRDLAALNGTLRDDENQICQNCGALGHKRYTCPERANVTNNIICRICGGTGHMARDCMARNDQNALEQARERDTKLDSEYATLMAELGAGSGGDRDRDRAPGAGNPWARPGGTGGTGRLSFASGGSGTPTAGGTSTSTDGRPPWAGGTISRPSAASANGSASAAAPWSSGNVAQASYPQQGPVDPSAAAAAQDPNAAYAAYYQQAYYQYMLQQQALQQQAAAGQEGPQ